MGCGTTGVRPIFETTPSQEINELKLEVDLLKRENTNLKYELKDMKEEGSMLSSKIKKTSDENVNKMLETHGQRFFESNDNLLRVNSSFKFGQKRSKSMTDVKKDILEVINLY